ncbi:Nif3-like dinuclear metal center hexameric protein [Gardnerella sp. 2492-Sm]|uniref:Nif3-like dinuclear metal center hexameric protein n=1 Tax=unclassified Gardnerella TaxID=2628112 RepID=UPI003D083065
MTTLYQTVQALESLYPLKNAESWDAPGLIVGDLSSQVHRIVCVSDPTLATVRRACGMDGDLLITHHPLFYKPVHEVSGNGVRGEIVRYLVESHCALWVGHTNADVAWRGVAHAAADYFGLQYLHPLVPSKDTDLYGREVGIGRVGELPAPMALRDFAQRVFDALPQTQVGVQVCGDINTMVRRVAVVPGAGDSYLDKVRECEADVYVTSDMRHHPTLDSIERSRYELQLRQSCGLMNETNNRVRPAIINTSHSAIESLWFNYAIPDIADAVENVSGARPEVTWFGIACDPWNYVIH